MTDDQWLKAIARYKSEETRFIEEGPPLGGAMQLSRKLEHHAKNEPERFARVLRRLPQDSNPSYFSALVRGISDGSHNVDLVLSVCEIAHSVPGNRFGYDICDAIVKLKDEEIPDSALDLVIHYGTKDRDPDREEWLPPSEGGAGYYEESPSNAGLNSVRGRAAVAIAQLLWSKASRWPRLRDAIELMTKDSSVAVRSWVAQVLQALFRVDPNEALRLFVQLCETDDRLLGENHVERFLAFAVRNHYSDVEHILKRMTASNHAKVQVAGGRRVCLASLFHEEAQSLLRSSLKGPSAVREGIAEVCAANAPNASFRVFCVELLTILFNDPEDKVRQKAAQVFWHLEESQAGQMPEVVSAFIDSDAFNENHERLFDALDEATVALPEETLRACELFLDLAGEYTSSFAYRASWTGSKVARIALRVYQQTDISSVKTRCLDLIDKMTDLGTFDLHKALATFER